MPIDAILYILAALVLYDLSLHIYDLLSAYKKTKAKHPFGAWRIFEHFSKGDLEKKEKVRQVFWTSYWGVAFVLFAVYFLTL